MTRRVAGLVGVWLLLLQLLVACLGVAASHSSSGVSAAEHAYLQVLHAPQHAAHLQALHAAFRQLDVNADGTLDAAELHAHQRAGTLSHMEHTLMQAFDADGDGQVSQDEWTMAPYQLNLLETSSELDAEVESRRFHPHAHAHADAGAGVTAEMQSAEAAFEGRPSPWLRVAPMRPMRSRAAATSFMESEAHTILANARRIKRKKRGAAPLPVSIFGVPSVADEECVMCQYFVQRIQSGVADRVMKRPTARANAPAEGGAAGLAGAAIAAQHALKVRNINSALAKRPGGRGIVRVVAEDVLQTLCAVDKMPLLFNPYCTGFVEPNAINAVRKAIFFNMPTAEVCQQAALCRDDSYLNTNAAVHTAKTSAFLNGQRGICGMLGGAKDNGKARDAVLINAICAAHSAVFRP